MKIKTSRFGTLDLPEDRFIFFPWGIPGFEQLKRFVLLEHRQGPFRWLQAVDDPDVAFVVCPPDVFGVQYKVPEQKASLIGLQSPEDLAILLLISVDREKGNVRPHLRSPLIMNASTRLAFQWVIDSKEQAEAMEAISGEGVERKKA